MTANRIRFILVTLLVFFTLALLGLYQLDADAFRAAPGHQLYRALQLLVLEGDWTTEHAKLPLALQIARFIARLATVATLFLLFAEGLWTAIVNVRMRMFGDHIIIVGLSDVAMPLIEECVKTGHRVTAIERNPDNPYLKRCRDLRVPVALGDCLHETTLTRTRIARASALVSFIGGDGQNIELSLATQRLLENIGDRSRRPLKVVLRVADIQLANRLERYPKFFDHPTQIEVRFFNLDKQAARTLFRDFEPDVYADALGAHAVHIVIIGYGALGRHVLMQALQQAHYGNNERLKVTVLDRDTAESQAEFARSCPQIDITADVRFADTPVSAEAISENATELGITDATMFVSSVGSDSENLSIALALRQQSLAGQVPNAPVFVALRNTDGLAHLVETGQGNPEIPDGLYPFGSVEDLVRVDRVIDEQLDTLAVAQHEAWLEQAVRDGTPKPSQRP